MQANDKERRLGVAAAWIRSRCRGMVSPVQAGDIFFIHDGHQRIAVARAMGEQAIEARVVRPIDRDALAEPMTAAAQPVAATGQPQLSLA